MGNIHFFVKPSYRIHSMEAIKYQIWHKSNIIKVIIL